jgi:hypothetical protein
MVYTGTTLFLIQLPDGLSLKLQISVATGLLSENFQGSGPIFFSDLGLLGQMF